MSIKIYKSRLNSGVYNVDTTASSNIDAIDGTILYIKNDGLLPQRIFYVYPISTDGFYLEYLQESDYGLAINKLYDISSEYLSFSDGESNYNLDFVLRPGDFFAIRLKLTDRQSQYAFNGNVIMTVEYAADEY